MNKYKKILFEIVQKVNERPHVSTTEQIFFIKRLSFLIKADIPVLESLDLIRTQTKSKNFIRILNRLIIDISEGRSLSASLEKFGAVFGEFTIHIIQFGESSGTLPENLEYLATEMNKRRTLKRKILAAFAYPAIVTLATCGITAFLVMYLFPKIMPVFQSLRITLPLSTRIVMSLSILIRSHGLLIVAIISTVIVTYIIVRKKNKKLCRIVDGFFLRLPLVGTMTKEYVLANTTRTLGLLLKSGTTLSEAIPITIKTTGHSVYKETLAGLSPIVNRGENISSYFEKHKLLFPDIFTQIISIGERSGNLSNSFLYISSLYEEQVDEFTKNISTLIEPILMTIMGLVIGFIAVSIITPIYGITQNLHP